MKVIGNKGKSMHADAETLRLMALVEASRFADVERVARNILAGDQRHPLALKALSFALIGLRRFEEVLPVVDFALAAGTKDGELHNNRAIALAELMRWDEAIPEFEGALKLAPGDFEIQKNLGVAYSRLHKWNEAVPYLLKAIELHPGDYVDAIEVLARCLYYARRLDEAYVVCLTLHREFPEIPDTLHRLTEIELMRCSWDGIEDKLERIREAFTTSQWANSPWGFFKYWQMGMHHFLLLAERFAAKMIPDHVRGRAELLRTNWRKGVRPLRVGFMSSDFGDHPVSHVIVRLLECLSRRDIQLFGYALRPDDGSPQRQRAAACFASFVEATELSVAATRDRIRADQIDVLIDLNGWTGRGRAEALALRCAPVQMTWVGYAGTMGSSQLADYIIGDAIVIPESHEQYFVERVVRMPHSFMPVDPVDVGDPLPARQAEGLPDAAFVLCSFNATYKFNPPVFDLWCALMRQMPDAVLWLLKGSQTAMDNLCIEAERRGISAKRLIFAERTPTRAAYLSRLRLADLALDPFPYNSHSTGVDALVAGVPLVSMLGETFPGRVGASLLHAAGLDELVAQDVAGYESLVLRLYRERQWLAEIRQRLADAKASAPLFDMPGFARDLEDLLYRVASDTAVLTA